MSHSFITISLDMLGVLILAAALLPAISILMMWIASNERSLKAPSDEEVDAACRCMFDTFDTLPVEIQHSTRRSARLWLRAWQYPGTATIKTQWPTATDKSPCKGL